ncbi:metalloreductase STEAP3-like [Branchiostoma floridae]|uniref:Metalloreductase STEAP3-like n=1 Tax=Branchiostoma floridae TaxID=7739 RepID=A0A9J7MWQ8_BRAFL|nr:metalloreductase STEAP3-like [Branchiostoma floridae]
MMVEYKEMLEDGSVTSTPKRSASGSNISTPVRMRDQSVPGSVTSTPRRYGDISVGTSRSATPKRRTRSTLDGRGLRDAPPPIVGILGCGEFGLALARKLLKSGYQVVLGTRDPEAMKNLVPLGVTLTTRYEAVLQAEVVFLAVRRDHYDQLVFLTDAMSGKILVDVSITSRFNDGLRSNAEYLQWRLFPSCRVVKGFNVIPAAALDAELMDGPKQVYLCGDDHHAKATVTHIVYDLGFIPVDLGALKSAGHIETIPARFLPYWGLPVSVGIWLFIVMFLYVMIQDIIRPSVSDGSNELSRLPLFLVNRVLAFVAGTLLSAAFFPDIFIRLVRIFKGYGYRDFPVWLGEWRKARRHICLVGVIVGAVHAIMSLTILSPTYYPELYEKTSNRGIPALGKMMWSGEAFASMGAVCLSALLILGIANMPSGKDKLNWRETTFLWSNLGTVALFTATFHVVFLGIQVYPNGSLYSLFTLPVSLISLFPLAAAVLLKCVTLIPYLQKHVISIRDRLQGRKRLDDGDELVECVVVNL